LRIEIRKEEIGNRKEGQWRKAQGAGKGAKRKALKSWEVRRLVSPEK
jgi:hypothetical protein